jgi:hypothetical protein
LRNLGRIYLRLRTLLLAGAATSLPGSAAPQPADQAAWVDAQRAGTIEAYQDFLESYPTSPLADQAFRSLVEQSLLRDISPGGSPGGGGFAADMY